MSHRGPLTAVVTAVLGATLGGLLIWRVYRTKRKRLPSIQKAAESLHNLEEKSTEVTAVECTCIQPPHVVKDEFQTVHCQTTLPARILSSDHLLGIKPVIVTSEEEWQQLWPIMQKELSVFPVLGFDCEWVKTSAVRNTFCMFFHFFKFIFFKKEKNPPKCRRIIGHGVQGSGCEEFLLFP